MTDNMPDFDKMSPAELMAWMESLAKRQGAAEGFTTSADVDVPEIDPDAVEIDEPGYIPYGMDTEKWEAKKAEEDRIRAERMAQVKAEKAAAAPPPAPTPEPEPVPAPPPAVSAPAASSMPDLDSMSPDELMKWMESLAKRQGADEGFTTTADAAVPEIDPGAVQIDEPGYIPYGMDADTWARKQADEQARKAARAASAAAPPEPVKPPPAAVEPPAATIKPVPEPEPDVVEAGEEFVLDLDFDLEATAKTPARNAQDALAWLERLAADAGTIPGVDLGNLEEFNAPPVAPVPQDDPLAWLESLSQAQTGIPGLEGLSELEREQPAPPEPSRPAAQMPPAEDPLAWLETLARRQGALDEELITDANLDVPEAAAPASTGPGYTDFNADWTTADDYSDARADFESEEIQFDIDAIDENIDDWLTAIASGQIDDAASDADVAAAMAGIEEPDSGAADLSTNDIMSALKQGQDVSPDVMSSWMSSMLDAGARRTDVTDYLEDDEQVAAVTGEGEIEEAELPDWLLQQVGAPPPADALAEPNAEAEDAAAVLESLGALEEIALPPDVEMPDWLRDSLEDAGDSAADDLQRIFADELEAVAEPDLMSDDEDDESSAVTQRVETAELQVDTTDPWVAAFEEERRQGDAIPAWYVERLQALQDGGEGLAEEAVSVDEALAALAADASAASGAVIELAAAMLPPERELSPGELMAVPDWLEVDAEPEALEFEASDEDVIETPDFAAFMASVEAGGETEEPALDLPDWLRDQAADADEVVAPLEEVMAAAGEDLPEWLKEAGVSEDEVGPVPEWLIESLGEDSQDVREVTYLPQLSTPEPAPVPAPAPQTSPAPVIPAAASIDVAAALNEARTKIQTGDVEVSLQSYEAVVRANQQLDEVVKDLSALLTQDVHKKNPTVYRVLGDGLMRQGNLQKALDTYRQALNLL